MNDDIYKIVQSGHIVELYVFQYPLVTGIRKEKKKKPVQLELPIENLREDEYKMQSMWRARNMIRRLVLSNFNNNSKFVTLTFDPKKANFLSDIERCNNEYKKFIKRLNYSTGTKIKYLTVIEYQKNGNPHYHMVCDLSYFPVSKLIHVWNWGSVSIRNIEKVDNVGAYIIKYMVKDFNKKFANHPLYLRSRGLLSPRVSYHSAKNANVLHPALKLSKPVYKNEYKTKWNGIVKYYEFNPNRKPLDNIEKLL